MKTIYFDHAAASPIEPLSLATFNDVCQNNFANPAATHTFGQHAEHLLQECRQTVAKLLAVSAKEIVFTCSATEANNLAIRGIALQAKRTGKGNHILISAVEHPAVEATARDLEINFGFDVQRVPVDSYGCPNLEQFRNQLRSSTVLVSFILANNEIGTIMSIAEYAAACRERQIPFHTDASQACAWMNTQGIIPKLNIDLLTASGRKLGAPGGGFLYIRKAFEGKLAPIITGGGHENGMRSGTPHVAEVAAMAKAFQIRQQQIVETSDGTALTKFTNVTHLRDHIIDTVLRTVPNSFLTGSPNNRLPNHASFAFENIEGNALARRLDLRGFAVSPGAACKTGNPAPSAVLKALGYNDDIALGGLRISLGFEATLEDVNLFLSELPGVIAHLRKNNS